MSDGRIGVAETRTWQGRTSLHLVLPEWHAVHARRTEGAFAAAALLASAGRNGGGVSRFLLPSPPLALAEALLWRPESGGGCC